MKFLFLILLAGCPQPQPPHPDASDAASVGDAPDSCTKACSNLAAIGCLEGADVHCVQACAKNAAAPIVVQPVACWGAASDKSAARACGGLRCP